MVLQEVAGNRTLYRSPEEMAPTRRLKDIQSKAWFKPSRGGKKVSLAKTTLSRPTSSTQGQGPAQMDGRSRDLGNRHKEVLLERERKRKNN